MGLNTGERKLLDKFNLSVKCLDYKYIENSRSVKELENILLVLRSGEEGVYPDLTKFCENKLCELSPDSKHLQASKPVSTTKVVSLTEQQTLEKEMQEWANKMKELDAEISRESSSSGTKEVPYPIRNSMPVKHNHDSTNEKEQNRKKLKNNKGTSKTKPPSFDEWEKFNAEEELEKLDKSEKSKSAEHPKEKTEKVILHRFVDVSGLTEKECLLAAESEKTKGNDAFKVQDYKEAELYYSRSISAFPTAAALNNRAFSHIKLKNFDDALYDCNAVLNLEPDNVKALYRRGLVHKEVGRVQLAFSDFQSVLELEPTNKAAKEQLLDLEKVPCKYEANKSPVMIKEISGSDAAKAHKECLVNSTITKPSQNLKSGSSAGELNSKSNKNVEKTVPAKANLGISNETSKIPSKPQELLNTFEENVVDQSEVVVCENSNVLDIQTINHKNSKNYIPSNPDISTIRTCADSKRTNSNEEEFVRLQPRLCKCDEQAASETTGSTLAVDGGVLIQNVDEKGPGYVKKNLLIEGHDTSKAEDVSERRKNFEHVYSNSTVPEKSDIMKGSKEVDISTNFSELHEEITPFKFLTLWHNMDASKNITNGIEILKKISPEQLPVIISNRLDGDLLFGIIRSVTEIVKEGELENGYKYMIYLTKVPRIKTICAFLSTAEQEEIKGIATKFKEVGKDVDCLKKTFGIS